MPRQQALVELLTDLFDADGLRTFAWFGEHGEEMRVRLPTAPASLFLVAGAAVRLWEEFDCVDGALFDRLVAEFPRREGEIRRVQEGWFREAEAGDGTGIGDGTGPVDGSDAEPTPWERWRPWGKWAVAIAVPPLLALTALPTRLEAPLQARLLSAFGGSMEMEHAVVVAVEPQPDLRSSRVQHPGVIAGLVEAGAAAIVFDLAFSSATEHDAEIARAIHEASAAGVTVVLPVRFQGGVAVPPATEALALAAPLGAIEAERDALLGLVRRIRVRTYATDGQFFWHTSVLGAQGLLHAHGEPEASGGRLVVGVTHNPLTSERLYLHPTGEVPVVPYDDPGSWSAVAGKVAVIGLYGGSADLLRTPDGPRYGVEIVAIAIETLLRQKAPRVLSTGIDAVAALLLALLALALGRFLRRGRWKVGALVAVMALVAGTAAAATLAMVQGTPLVLALVLGTWASPPARESR